MARLFTPKIVEDDLIISIWRLLSFVFIPITLTSWVAWRLNGIDHDLRHPMSRIQLLGSWGFGVLITVIIAPVIIADRYQKPGFIPLGIVAVVAVSQSFGCGAAMGCSIILEQILGFLKVIRTYQSKE
jgi:hypothetical protein